MNNGKILLVGFGPGDQKHMTFRAREAIAEADVVIGYSTYIKLVADLLEGKEVIRKGMTEEIDRCVEALDQAKRGKIVALVSSGDIGIYGMAGPTYEVLLQSGWTPDSGIDVEVVPGSTALSSCAALVGAPLTHDFCSISLSDLLTPWPVIARRLEAAGRGDFVVALYNPKSGRRTQQIVEAQRILLQYREPETPVAVVKSGHRSKQRIEMVRLDQMAECDIGMLTTVLIGNSSTYLRENLMITPRGYANKYDRLTGEVLAGEKAGRSLSMGLDGWKACVRGYLRQSPEQALHDTARYFDAPMDQILEAIAEAGPDDAAGEFQARWVAPANTDKLIDAAHEWGRLRVVVRGTDGAVAELLIHAADFNRRHGRLSIVTDHFHLHVDWGKVSHAWLVSRGAAMHGVYFMDHGGQPLFTLALVKHEQAFDPAALAHYFQAREQLGHAPPLKAAINE